jgi:hypothetical protein
MNNGWDQSARARIASMGERGDWARQHVVDPVMLERRRTPLVWMTELNGPPVDFQDMSRGIEEIAFRRRIDSL